MELLHLKYFQTVARYQHITQAAKSLNLSQPSLSIMIARLEDELGTKLFERRGRNIKLNEAGKIFSKHVERIFLDLENAKRELKEFAGSKSDDISIVGTSSRLLSGLIFEYLLINHEIKFHQFVSSFEGVKDYLKKQEIDFCITSPMIEDVGIKSIELLDEEIFICVPLSHRYAQCKSIKLKDVANDNFLCLSEGYSFRNITNNLCKMAGFSPNVVFEGDYIFILQLMKIGKGIAFVPQSSIKAFQDVPIAFIKIEEPICRRNIGLSWLEGKYFTEAANSFKPFIINYFKNTFSSF